MLVNWTEYEESVRCFGNPPGMKDDPTIARTGDSKWWFYTESWEPVGPYPSRREAERAQYFYIEKNGLKAVV